MKRSLIVLSLTAIALTGCSLDKSQPNVELIQDFLESPAIKAQEYDASSPNNSGMRVPPENTVPRGFEPYKYTKDFDGAVKQTNPLSGDFSEKTMKVGIKYYNTNCKVCHGAHGEGSEKVSVAEFMALKPPALTTAKAVGLSDGNIYHIITMGQGVMGPYAAHIPAEYRWQVVNYIRHLQKQDKK